MVGRVYKENEIRKIGEPVSYKDGSRSVGYGYLVEDTVYVSVGNGYYESLDLRLGSDVAKVELRDKGFYSRVLEDTSLPPTYSSLARRSVTVRTVKRQRLVGGKKPRPFFEDSRYYGTQHYWKLFGGIYITDGVKAVLERFGAFWTTDILYELPKEDFFVIKVVTYEDDDTADVIAEDGNGNIVKKRHYKYTNLTTSLKFYYIDGVLLLPSEY